MAGVAVAWGSVSWGAWLGAGGAVVSGLSIVCNIVLCGSSVAAVAVAVAVAAVTVAAVTVVVVLMGVTVVLGLRGVSVTNWRVVVVHVVWVGSLGDNAAADNSGSGLAVVIAVSGHSDSSGKELLVATSEVLLEDGLLPSVSAVGVVGDPLGIELALVWKPGVADLGAVGAGFSAVLMDGEIKLGAV